MLNKIIEEVKNTERTADEIIKEADDKAGKIINNAHEEADNLIEKIKKIKYKITVVSLLLEEPLRRSKLEHHAEI